MKRPVALFLHKIC